jgi:hypothetical protein
VKLRANGLSDQRLAWRSVAYTFPVTWIQRRELAMRNDGEWILHQQYTGGMIGAGVISAAIRAADDADWELDDALNFNEPFDPFADDPE